jgi:hypothetical protein
MTTTFNWTIPQMDRLTSDGFVCTVHYNVTATDDTFSASTYGTIGYTQQPDETYTPYADLTQEQVVGWVKTALGEEGLASMEEALSSQIVEQKSPKMSHGTPWTVV